MNTISYFIGFAIILLMMIAAIILFKKVWRTASRLRNYTMNFSLSVLTFIVLFFLIDVYFYVFFVRSDSFSFTLANQRWFELYWKPINQLGYRDLNYSEEELQKNQLIFVVGDSFVAGQGIKNYQDRFSNRLGEKLPKGWIVLNIAQVGWSTTEEYQAVISHPYRPKILILSYFVDDIRGATHHSQVKEKFRFTELVTPPSPLVGGLIKHSYFLNFFYWEWYRYYNRQPEEVYWQRLRNLYGEGEAWRVHQEELRALVEYAKKNQVVLLPIIFPNLISMLPSKPIVNKVQLFFQSLDVKTIDLSSAFSRCSPADLIVNNMDAHPNELVNAQVAEILYEEINTIFFKMSQEK